jgi:hypothetical protein
MKRERETGERVERGLVRNAIFKERGQKFLGYQQCPFLLPVDVRLREGKALRSEKVKVLGSGFCYEPCREFEHGRHCLHSELNTKLKIEILFNHV